MAGYVKNSPCKHKSSFSEQKSRNTHHVVCASLNPHSTLQAKLGMLTCEGSKQELSQTRLRSSKKTFVLDNLEGSVG